MSDGKQTGRTGIHGAHLSLEHFHGLMAEMSHWRIDSILQMMESKRESGRTLGFVRGLRFSARLIYALRDRLSSQNVEVDWGHLLDDQGNSCSPECDIIIHRPGFLGKWNGTKNPVMDFRFIARQNAVAVISCKSFANSIDQKYVKRMRPFQENILLFSECCDPRRAIRLVESARQAGYKGFWYLYTFNRKSCEVTQDENQWRDFLDSVERIVCHRTDRKR